MASHRARRARNKKLKGHKDFLRESVRTLLLPAFIDRRFAIAPRVHGEATEQKSLNTLPFGLLRRPRADGGVDLVEIQFSSYQRAAFRINACPVPKDGMMTAAGHRFAEELEAGGLHDHFETHARPWLRPALRALRIEPLGQWFSLSLRCFRSPKQAAYDKLALRVAAIIPEIELALCEGKLGPHILRIVMTPFPPDVLERLEKLRAEGAGKE
jgi:hypothetical protein